MTYPLIEEASKEILEVTLMPFFFYTLDSFKNVKFFKFINKFA